MADLFFNDDELSTDSEDWSEFVGGFLSVPLTSLSLSSFSSSFLETHLLVLKIIGL